jgi:hypothetical protein
MTEVDKVGYCEEEEEFVIAEWNVKKLRGFVVRKRTIPTERPPLVSEASANFCGERVPRGQRNGSPWPLISVFETGAATFSFK